MNTSHLVSSLSRLSFKLPAIAAVLVAIFLTSGITVKAQFTATWPLLAAPGKTPTVTGAEAARVTAGDMVPGANFASGGHNNDGFQCKLSTNWPSTPTDDDHLDFPLSPVTGFDVTITGLTIGARTSGASNSNTAQLAYQVDGSGPWIQFGSPQNINSGGSSNLNFGTLSQTFFSGHTYVIRLYAYAAGSTVSSSRNLYLKNVAFTGTTTVAGTPPSVTTDGVGNFTNTTAIATGTITAGTIPILSSGVAWGIDPLPLAAAPNYTTNGPTTTGAIGNGTGGNMTGLSGNTSYYVRAYVTTIAGTTYGNAIPFTTPVPDYDLTSNTGSLDFGSVSINSSSVLSYSVSGKNLSPANGDITVTAPAGFTVSTSTAGPFSSSILLPYTGGALASTTVYVKYTPTVAFTTTSGTITLSGGGVIGDDILNETVSGRGKLTDPAVTSNVGNDFWLGFGYHAQMKDVSSGRTRADLSIYVSNPSNVTAHMVVEMPGISGFVTMTQDILPGGFYEFSGFPLGDGTAANTTNAPDSRLYYTGVSNRAIHVYSSDGTPVSVWLYDYTTNNSAAGSLIFPTNTWNTSYTVQTIGGQANGAGSPNSFFFIVAQEDGTEIEITPTGDILDSVAISTIETSSTIKYTANGTFTITLNKGQIFNALSPIVGSIGVDLSGSLVKSLNCKKFAVFAGNGRNGIGNDLCNYSGGDGSDNLIQQMFPKVAWGTKYYTVPTKNMEYNTFRITVDDPATQVWVNKSANPTALTNFDAVHKFYEIYTNTPSVIESDKPISVTQFIASQSCGSQGGYSYLGNIGEGDPEMIILSPAAQAINKVTVFSPSFKNNTNGAGYINVVIPTSAVNTFKLDYDYNANQQPLVDTGSNSYTGTIYGSSDAPVQIAQAFQPFPNDATYSWAKFKVNFPSTHTLEATTPFNAFAYGMSEGESYGFNAGTQVNDLTAPLILNNPYGDSLNSLNSSKPLTTCRGTEVALSATLPFENVQGQPITFSYGNNANITPNADDVITNPVLSHTFVFNGQTFYVYKLAQKHVFSVNDDYQINVTYFNPTPSDGCGGQGGSNKTISYTIKVVDGVAPAYTVNYNSCQGPTVTITGNTTSSTFGDIVSWKWTYDNGSKPLPNGQDIVKEPSFANPVDNTALNVKLLAINSIGCFGELQKPLPGQAPITLTFDDLPTGLCNTPTAAFELTNYGHTTPAGANGTFTFAGNGVEKRGDVYWFNPSLVNVSTTQPNVITYSFTGANGCPADPKTKSITIGSSTVLTLDPITPTNSICVNAATVALTTNNVAGGVVSGPGVTLSGNTYSFNPTTAGAGTHHITYTKSGDACSTPASRDIQVVALPNVGFSGDIPALCSNAQAITLTQGTPTGGIYTGTGVTNNQGTYTFNPAAQGVSTTTPNPITYTVTVAGCTNNATGSIIVNAVPTISAGPDLSVEQNVPITITGSPSGLSGTYSWTPTTGLISGTNAVETQAQIAQIGTYPYTLTATVNNCSASDEMILTVRLPQGCLDPMKGFTPNGDGKNEKWQVYRDGSCFVTVQVDVYNRWGALVYHADKYNNDWTGQYKGKNVPDATYYYVVKATDGTGHTQIKTGNVTIIR